ncbi:DUF5107 domain-containing protein [Paenibacillus sp. LHD-117]|uniref:DUF5107 domain-containing protein n=1 Tax=Paenibacillus sp. LHD-117 TaxID=3071412 RepID=UPI0027DF592F|nr:DUF5107 domain-containing protein [Paenibacillus sp. LHD-117]MDQ6421655.1 DUF5107 domain-containing protein [Paenibacillus sp. LHD-117]
MSKPTTHTEDAKPVRIWEEIVAIPTYGIGAPDRNPMFLEKRVYQGSSGKVYPHPVIDRIEDEKNLRNYRLAVLENEYIRIEIMPELGGRIYRALDKTNSYDFVYYNRVIKPALVGLAGPWISGGIEFNWPQHHRPNTYGPVEHVIENREDGSATVWVSEIDRMYGTKMTAGFTLRPGKAYLEISAQLYNRTPEPQTFLWWANPAVAVNDNTQSVFPPDVTAVFDHGKRDVSKFPIATGTYYKMDYSEGVDISRYRNIPVPTSYMAYKSDYNFVGGYDHGVQAGLLHVANHHISPGKKQWTWGNGDFGQAWDRNLTDEDGPYIELMTGVYTDNQPDFTWLAPYEEKSFKQYFMPYKDIGIVKNASIDAAVNLEIDDRTREATVLGYATSVFNGAIVELKGKRRTYFQEKVLLSPESTYKRTIVLDEEDRNHDLYISIRSNEGKLLVSYKPAEPAIEQVPEAAKPLPEPAELRTNEELYLAGLHLEQYRHATFEPEAYYLEGLKRDPSDIRINVAYGTLLLKRGLYSESETHFRAAIGRATWRNPNPYDGEAYYQLGLSLKGQGRTDEAFSAFYKSTWSAAWQDAGYLSLAQIAMQRQSYEEALDLSERSLVRNSRNCKTRNVKTAALRKLGRTEEAIASARGTIGCDVADFGARFELKLALEAAGEMEEAQNVYEQLMLLMRGDVHNHLALASDYEQAGLYRESIEVMCMIVPSDTYSAYPLAHYALAYLLDRAGDAAGSIGHLRAGGNSAPDYCFPNSLFELLVLESAIRANPADDKAHYYLGNLLYDKKRHADAISAWEASREINDRFPTVHRNLALAYYNKSGDSELAKVSMEKAFSLDEEDARVFFELDQLYKKLGVAPERRLSMLSAHKPTVELRDDLYLEYVTLLNAAGLHREALQALEARMFHPWEGGEGKATGQHVLAHVELAKKELAALRFSEAAEYLEAALVYPERLGEGKLEGAQENHVYYYLGLANEGLGRTEAADSSYLKASRGLVEPAGMMYYNDQPPESIFYQGLAWRKLGVEKEAMRRFHKLIDYSEKHLRDDVKFDYFAVSLPDFLVFEDDLNKRNRIHCRFMRGLGLIGLGRHSEAREELEATLAMDMNHSGARIHLEMLS